MHWKHMKMEYEQELPENFENDITSRPYKINEKENDLLIGTDHPKCFSVYTKMNVWSESP